MRRRTVVGLVAAASLVAVPAAPASYTVYHNGALGSDSRDASPSYAALRYSLGRSSAPWLYIYVAAHYPGSWDRAGSWAYAQGIICKGYASEYLGALVWNPHSVTQDPVYAEAGYNSGSC